MDLKPAIALSGRAKLLIAGGLVVILLLAGAYFLGKQLTDEQRLIARFENAIRDGKTDKVMGMLSDPNKGVGFNKETAQDIVTYLQSNKETLDQLIARLKSEAELLKGPPAASVEQERDTAFLYLHKKEEKRWFLYDDYELKINRYSIPVTTNFAGTKVLIDGKEAGTAKGENETLELGTFLPGQYEIKAVYEGKYTTLESASTVSLFPMANNEDLTVELTLEGDYVEVQSNNSYAHIYINGEDIELAVGDGQRIGPIAVDGSNRMFVEVEYPWGKARSEELAVDSNRLEFNVPGLDDSLKNDIMSAAFDFVSSWMQSFREQKNVLRHVHPDRSGDMAEYLADMERSKESYTGELHRATFDLDSFKLNQFDEHDYSITVKVKLDYREVFYFKEYETDPVPVEGSNYTEYQLQYVDGQWLVSGWSNVEGMGTDNTKVYE
ncbi:zinc ribbon domain-containing protein [Cohnella herbarum]|uniref:PEGA domain-containing protein n=1 Tax=Cohnella herbarum TaxID=2728023 RepID=A0A7Z2VPB7_9BACL|nr:hypothetical protein [Cohnella herbarum]QJD86787.1 hypothetical protein HH215_28855 [Cohnella herbarum]